MRFEIPDHLLRWLGPVTIVGIGLMVIFSIPVSRDALCEPEKNCMISWVSALSGWAALAGALLTISVMREQLAEQKRQTDFITGDNPPEAFLDSSFTGDIGEMHSEIKVTVINRNRRTLVLHRLEAALPENFFIGIRATTVDNDKFEWPLSKMARFNYVHRAVPGKEDGARASQCAIDCHVFHGKELAMLSSNTDRWTEHPVTVTVFGYFKGAVDTPVQFTISGTVSVEDQA